MSEHSGLAVVTGASSGIGRALAAVFVDHVVAGSFKNRVQAGAARVLPERASAAAHARMAKPRSTVNS
jgi:NAD(P)-dependent dehydrogenase (short-subunit alcohol dehydrogenase family)